MIDFVISLEEVLTSQPNLQDQGVQGLSEEACLDICIPFELGPFVVKNPFGVGFGWELKWLDFLEEATVKEFRRWLEDTNCEEGCVTGGFYFPYLNVDVVPANVKQGTCPDVGKEAFDRIYALKTGLNCRKDAVAEFMRQVRELEDNTCGDECDSVVFLSKVENGFIEPKTGFFDECTYYVAAWASISCSDKAVNGMYEVSVSGEGCIGCSEPSKGNVGNVEGNPVTGKT